MPMFYFHIRQRKHLIEDADGLELPDLPTAIAEAHEDVRSLVAERLQTGKAIEPHVIEITDNRGLMLAKIGFQDVVMSLIRR